MANEAAPKSLQFIVVTPEKAHLVPREIAERFLSTCRSPRLGKPEDIAAMVALLASSDGEWINGQCITVDGGMQLGR